MDYAMTSNDKAVVIPHEGAPRAKPLFWYKSTDHPQDGGEWTAHGIGGRYTLQKEQDHVLLWWADDNFVWEKCADYAEAKAKAEADWQKKFAERMLP
jgi:hypothetical protein